jgi:trans-aconitate methyltransferase
MCHEPHQTWNPRQYEDNAGFVAELAGEVLSWLAPQPDERILDLGCGDGRLSLEIAQSGAQVLAVDDSAEMVAAAKERGLDAHVMQGQALEFDGEFDAVFSNAALHWMHPPEAVISGVARALKPGGRFVGEMGGHGNVATITVALMAVLNHRGLNGAKAIPWFFPTVDEYAELLKAGGFAIKRIILFPRPTRLPKGINGWLAIFSLPFLGLLPDSQREAAREEAIALLRPVLQDRQGNWVADYVRLRFEAVLPGHGG